MALITCPECSKSISNQAKVCQGCGFPITRAVTPSASQKPSSNIVNIPLGFTDIIEGFSLRTEVVCPHCGKMGCVATMRSKQKKGISGGKATGALLTAGLSVLVTGLSRKESVSEAMCKNCGVRWQL